MFQMQRKKNRFVASLSLKLKGKHVYPYIFEYVCTLFVKFGSDVVNEILCSNWSTDTTYPQFQLYFLSVCSDISDNVSSLPFYRLISRDDIVIIDAGNYIKGKYQVTNVYVPTCIKY
jgi:hypothetical protein